MGENSAQNQLAVINNPPTQAVTTYGFDPAIFQIRPAKLDIVQKMSRDQRGKYGYFLDTKSGRNLKEIQIVMTTVPQPNRLLMPKGQFGAKPICKSRDGLVPITDDNRLMPQAPKCGYYKPGKYGRMVFVATCDHANWDKWHKGGRKQEDKPGCRFQKRLYVCERKTALPYFMEIHGTSLKPFDEAMEGLAREAMILQAEGLNPEPYWYTMRFGLQEKTDGGLHQVLTISDIDKLPDNEISKFKALFEAAMAARNGNDDDQQEDAVIEGEIVNEGPAASA